MASRSLSEYEKEVKRAKALESKARQTEDLDKKAGLFLSAAKMRRKLGHKDDETFCLGNYYHAVGSKMFELGKYREAAQNLSKSLEIFARMKLLPMTLHTLRFFIKAYSSAKDFSDKNLDKAEAAIAEIEEMAGEEIQKSPVYLSTKLRLLEQRAFSLRKIKTRESLRRSLEIEETALQLAESSESGYAVDRIKINKIRTQIRLLKTEQAPNLEIAGLYFQAAELNKMKGDEKHYLADMSDAYQHKGLHHLDRSEFSDFFDNVEKSLDFAKLSGNESSYSFVLGLKYEIEAKTERQPERKLKCLKLSKESFYKSGNQHAGKIAEYHLEIELAKKAREKDDLQAYLKVLERIIRIATSLNYGIESFQLESLRLRSFLEIQKGNFAEASGLFEKYVNGLGRIGGQTILYERMRYVPKILEYLSRSSYTEEDSIALAQSIVEVSEKKLGVFLTEAYTLLFNLVSMQRSTLLGHSAVGSLREQVIRSITGQEETEFERRDIASLKYLNQHEWYLRFPTHIIANYENFEWFLCDCPPDLKNTAFEFFYREVLEPLLLMIVEFNSKLEWRDSWQAELVKTAGDARPVEKYSLGILTKCVRALKSKTNNCCSQLNQDALELLDKHIEIRNRLTHVSSIEPAETFFVKEIRELLFELRTCTPVLVLVQQHRGEGYRATLLWGHSPHQVQLKISENLPDSTIYYINPSFFGETRDLYPTVLIAARQGRAQYEAFLTKTGHFQSFARHEEFFFLTPERKQPLIKTKGSVKDLAVKVVSARERGETFRLQDFEEVSPESGLKNTLHSLFLSPVRMQGFLWDVIDEGLNIGSQMTPPSFSSASACFDFALISLENQFGPPSRTRMIQMLQKTVNAMFKNIIVGGKGAGHYFHVNTREELLHLLSDFTEHFQRFGIVTPTPRDIERETNLYIHGLKDSDHKDALLLKIKEIMRSESEKVG